MPLMAIGEYPYHFRGILLEYRTFSIVRIITNTFVVGGKMTDATDAEPKVGQRGVVNNSRNTVLSDATNIP